MEELRNKKVWYTKNKDQNDRNKSLSVITLNAHGLNL